MDPGSRVGMTEGCAEAEVLGQVLDSSRGLGMTWGKGGVMTERVGEGKALGQVLDSSQSLGMAWRKGGEMARQ